ncbi:MAG: polyphosphate polymerase domain-containing protein [Clostridiales Family XIII bacterium]|nr:polyphosphate polymerase domain-containing protein [Clostridiales Family XIII bacterium]
MAIEIFNRYENKYLINEKTFSRICCRLSDYMELDAHNKQRGTYSIANIYYDTEDSHLIRTSLSKPKYKEKLRLRSYGVPGSDSKVYVEIKKKVNKLVNKRRSALKPDEAYAFLHDGIIPAPQSYMNEQVLREIVSILESNTVKPALCISYDRLAYFGIGRHDLRVSFDTNIQTRRYDLRLESGAYGEQLIDADSLIMEIKVAQSIPVWLCRLLSENKVYPVSFSKYGTEYKRMLKRGRERRIFFIPEIMPFPAQAKTFAAAIAQ